MRDVICSFCNHCTTLDLCRDANLIESANLDEATGKKFSVWKCASCDNPYNMSAIELKLVKRVHQRSMAFQVQDLVCKKCGQMKASNLDEYCSCSGAWKCEETAEEFRESMQPFLNVSEFYGFDWLNETVRRVLSV